jgi:hypothetical protein
MTQNSGPNGNSTRVMSHRARASGATPDAFAAAQVYGKDPSRRGCSCP